MAAGPSAPHGAGVTSLPTPPPPQIVTATSPASPLPNPPRLTPLQPPRGCPPPSPPPGGRRRLLTARPGSSRAAELLLGWFPGETGLARARSGHVRTAGPRPTHGGDEGPGRRRPGPAQKAEKREKKTKMGGRRSPAAAGRAWQDTKGALEGEKEVKRTKTTTKIPSEGQAWLQPQGSGAESAFPGRRNAGIKRGRMRL